MGSKSRKMTDRNRHRLSGTSREYYFVSCLRRLAYMGNSSGTGIGMSRRNPIPLPSPPRLK